MVDIFDLLKDILPYDLTFSLSLAFVVSLAILISSRYRTQWISLFDAEKILALRVFLLVFLIALTVTSVTQSTSLTLIDGFAYHWWVIPAYALFEVIFYGYRYYLRRLAGIPKHYLSEIYQILTLRQGSSGGFRVGSREDTPVELWCTAQTLHGFVLGFSDITLISKTTKVLGYYQTVGRNAETLWSERQTNCLLVPAIWALISLEELINKKGYAESLSASSYSQAVEMFHLGLKKLKQLQLSNGGWAPVGNLDDDLRIFPTTMAVWALALAIKHRKALSLEGDLLAHTIASMFSAIELLQKKYDSKSNMWDVNPARSVTRRMSGLTLMVYTALSFADTAVTSEKYSDESRLLGRNLHKWLDTIHEPVMAHIDSCLHRDIEDSETDSPYDHVIKANTDLVIPVAFYDWLPAAMLATNASKLTGRYSPIRDALREKRLTETLVKHYSHLHDWYTYRLAVILIAASFDME